MRNLVPSMLIAIPAPTHNLAELEAAFNARRRTLIATVDAAVLAGRIVTTPPVIVQPTMARLDGNGFRSQPRDGRGRLLGKAWLARAEAYSAGDVAWFRSPALTEGK